ncbi:MAG: AAA family ATPase [Methanosarcinaceae archaeon]|nr:AAA family ATPase [Methanosarcinaceae archaeon]
MAEIKAITISGFRGINVPPLALDFQGGTSMIVYGRNGSGKSSIVDAWEWLYSGKIEHLAREGAKEHAYPHKKANDGQTWIEVDFIKNEIGKIKVKFNSNKITTPVIEGNLSELKKVILHPCHFRYRDLTEFLYQTKAKKYEFLSSLMGFKDAVEIQKQLKTCSNLLEDKINELKPIRDISSKEYHEASGENPNGIDCFFKSLNDILVRQKIEPINEISKINTSLEKLRVKVENDENSRKLSYWKDIQRTVNRFYPIEDMCSDIAKFESDIINFKKDEEDISKLILLNLYEKGIEAIKSLEIDENCPLCDQFYDGNLLEYIINKYNSLEELSKNKKELEERRKCLFSSISELITNIENSIKSLGHNGLEPPIIQFSEDLGIFLLSLKECNYVLEKPIEEIDYNFDFSAKIDTEEFKSILNSETEIKEHILSQIQALERDESRKELVDDFQNATKLKNSFSKWDKINKKILRLQKIKTSYDKVKNDYVRDTKISVQQSFDTISSDVAEYFKVLERDNDALGYPKIKLSQDNDKAVELEVMFGGEPIIPAYKFLSESQLNSFGLSIFLASAKNFNPDFKFIILDDVINSFDTYKRSRVIALLSNHFSDYQVLLLTHDSIWLNLLQKSFPSWKRVHFMGWDYPIGPKVKAGKNTYEQIEDSLSEDKPTEAGWNFGRYLEGTLQELCENIGASVKFKRRNEYSLSEIFQSFETRMKKKIISNHSLVMQISDFGTDMGFRNFCDHWKDSETDYTCSEIRDIVQKWRVIENQIECEKCHKFIRYEKVDGYEHISCPCRELIILGNTTNNNP